MKSNFRSQLAGALRASALAALIAAGSLLWIGHRVHALLFPVIRTARHILRMTVRGFVRVRIACRAKGAGTKPRRCSGVVSVRRSHKHFTVRTGHARFVKVRLRRSVRRALHRHPVHAVVRVKVRSRGHTRVARKRVLLARLG